MTTETWADVRRTLIVLSEHIDNYDGHGAQKPSANSISTAITTSYKLEYIGAKVPTRVVPGVNGNIYFEWELLGETPADGKKFVEISF